MIVWYGRVSSQLQAERHGVDAQRHEVHAWATRNGLDASQIASYVDEGVSGSTMNRPAWQALQADIRAGKVKTLLVYSLDRIGRCTGATITAIENLKAQGIRLVIVKEGWDLDSPMAMLIVSILAAVADWQRKDIAEKSSAGVRTRIAMGTAWGGQRVPLGAKGGAKLTPEQWRAAIDRVKAGETPHAVAKSVGVSRTGLVKRLARG